MLRIYRRHRKDCQHASERYRRCSCPIYVEGSLGAEYVRKALDQTSWEAASDLVARWTASGQIGVVRLEVPTVAESGIPGYSATGWYGLFAPAGTPPQLVRRISAEAARAYTNPQARERLAQIGMDPVGSTPEEFVSFLRTEIAKWSKVVKEANIRID